VREERREKREERREERENGEREKKILRESIITKHPMLFK
jgi:hypothetical protein